MNKIDTTCEHSKIRLIAAAQAFQGCTRTEGTETRIPGTNKRILIGDDAYLAMVALPAAKGGITSLEGLTRYGWTEAYIGDTSELVEQADGTYVKFSDVERLLATQAQAPAPETDLHNAIMNIPCKRADHEFMNAEHRMLYKNGHRDARHAAAELALAHPAAAVEPAVEQVDPGKLGAPVPEDIITMIREYGDARADGNARVTSIANIILAIRRHYRFAPGASQAAPAAPEQVQADFIPEHWRSRAEWIAKGTSLGAEERGRLAVMLLRTILAAPSAAQVQAIPAGWLPVPRFPTEAMVVAIEDKIDGQLTASGLWPADMYRQDGTDIYAAMLKAVPSPTAPIAAAPAAPEQDTALLDFLDRWVEENLSAGQHWFTFSFDTRKSAREQIADEMSMKTATNEGEA